MTAPRPRSDSAPTVRDVCEALARAADHGLSWTIADLPDGAAVVDLDGIVYLDPDQPVSAAAAGLVETLDDMCNELDRPSRPHLRLVGHDDASRFMNDHAGVAGASPAAAG